jgi:GT2 family glycosyltransferase
VSRVDIVIVSYNSRDELRDCVEPLVHDPELELIVVDNASTDGSLESIADLAVTAIPLDSNNGFGSGCNVGWRSGSSPYVLFLNPDSRVAAGDVHRLADAAEEAGAAAAAPLILNERGEPAWSLRRFPTVRSIFGQALFAYRFFPLAAWTDEVIRDRTVYNSRTTCEWASGACLLVRRDVLEAVGGFDERFFLYCEEIDLCYRIHQRGARLVYDPAAVCTHVGGASAPRSSLLPVLAQSRVRYASKHFRPLRALGYRAGVACLAITHAVFARSTAARLGHARSLAVAWARAAADA